MSVTHEYPMDGVVYRHTETCDEVKYIGQTSEDYLLSINGNRTMELPAEDWHQYREFLEVDRNV